MYALASSNDSLNPYLSLYSENRRNFPNYEGCWGRVFTRKQKENSQERKPGTSSHNQTRELKHRRFGATHGCQPKVETSPLRRVLLSFR